MSFLSPLSLGLAVLIVPAPTAKPRLRKLLPKVVKGTEHDRRRLSRLSTTGSSLPVLLPLAAGLGITAAIGLPLGLPVGIAGAAATRWAGGRWVVPRDGAATDPLLLAAGWDLLAVGLRAGIPLPVIVRAVAEELVGRAAIALREVAALLELGEDPARAWEPALRHPDTAELARAARRSSRTGSAMADVAADLAASARLAVDEYAEARAQRAAVWITAPLGLCFLPAFLCLGVVPVVLGMVRRLTLVW